MTHTHTMVAAIAFESTLRIEISTSVILQRPYFQVDVLDEKYGIVTSKISDIHCYCWYYTNNLQVTLLPYKRPVIADYYLKALYHYRDALREVGIEKAGFFLAHSICLPKNEIESPRSLKFKPVAP